MTPLMAMKAWTWQTLFGQIALLHLAKLWELLFTQVCYLCCMKVIVELCEYISVDIIGFDFLYIEYRIPTFSSYNRSLLNHTAFT